MKQISSNTIAKRYQLKFLALELRNHLMNKFLTGQDMGLIVFTGLIRAVTRCPKS